MTGAKAIVVKPISRADANRAVRAFHYSGKVVNNSQLHLGVFLDGRCGGAMQFGPPLDRRKLLGLVAGTAWNDMLELNRMAFADWLPRNSESRALAVAFRVIRKAYPNVQWVVSFADAAQCGDGTIYRAAGFVLTSIKRNDQTWQAPGGQRVTRVSATKAGNILATGGASMASYKAAGFRPIPGYQLRYVYFLDPAARGRLTVPAIPFAKIAEVGAGMYRGKPRARSVDSDAPGHQPGEGGATPTLALQPQGGG